MDGAGMPRGTTRDSQSGIPISWRRHLASILRSQDKNLSGVAAEVKAQRLLEENWRRVELLTEEEQ